MLERVLEQVLERARRRRWERKDAAGAERVLARLVSLRWRLAPKTTAAAGRATAPLALPLAPPMNGAAGAAGAALSVLSAVEDPNEKGGTVGPAHGTEPKLGQLSPHLHPFVFAVSSAGAGVPPKVKPVAADAGFALSTGARRALRHLKLQVQVPVPCRRTEAEGGAAFVGAHPYLFHLQPWRRKSRRWLTLGVSSASAGAAKSEAGRGRRRLVPSTPVPAVLSATSAAGAGAGSGADTEAEGGRCFRRSHPYLFHLQPA